MSIFVVLDAEGKRKEAEADALLNSLPRDPDCPTYTEEQLARRGSRLVSVDSLADTVTAPPPALCDELRFLLSVCNLPLMQRLCLRLWIQGYSQEDIARRSGLSQQSISLRLRRALKKCYDNAPLSFRRFSQHTIYRAPARARNAMILRPCLYCGERFPLGCGCGRYCSTPCRESARRKRHPVVR